MNPTKHFASLLYFAVLLCLIVSTVYYVFALSAIFFGSDGQYVVNTGSRSTLTIGNKNSEGYLVPVHLTLQIPDSISYDTKYFGATAEDVYPHITTAFLKENTKIKAINVYDVSTMNLGTQTFITDSEGNYKNRKASKFQFIKYINNGDSQYLKIKTNDKFSNLILSLREQFIFLFRILQMLFLALILRELARKIYFTQTLSSYISKLGYAILFSQLIPVIYTFIDLKLFGVIVITPQILESLQNSYFENVKVLFNPTCNVEIYVVLLGSILILLTKLVKRGRILEEDNELTI